MAEQETYTTREQEHYEQIRQMSQTVAALQLEAEVAKSRAASKRKAFEEACDSLRGIIDRGPDLQGKLPGFQELAWRGMPLSAAGIVGKPSKCLQESGIATLGEMADFTKDGKPLTDIPGIGETTAEHVATLMEQFWIDHPEATEGGGDEVSAA